MLSNLARERPVLTLSDTVGSVSRKRPFPTELLLDWIVLGPSLIVSRAVLFVKAISVRELCVMYCSTTH